MLMVVVVVENVINGYGSAFGETRMPPTYQSRRILVNSRNNMGCISDWETAPAVYMPRRIYIGGHRQGTGLQWVEEE